MSGSWPGLCHECSQLDYIRTCGVSKGAWVVGALTSMQGHGLLVDATWGSTKARRVHATCRPCCELGRKQRLLPSTGPLPPGLLAQRQLQPGRDGRRGGQVRATRAVAADRPRAAEGVMCFAWQCARISLSLSLFVFVGGVGGMAAMRGGHTYVRTYVRTYLVFHECIRTAHLFETY